MIIRDPISGLRKIFLLVVQSSSFSLVTFSGNEGLCVRASSHLRHHTEVVLHPAEVVATVAECEGVEVEDVILGGGEGDPGELLVRVGRVVVWAVEPLVPRGMIATISGVKECHFVCINLHKNYKICFFGLNVSESMILLRLCAN